MPTLVNDKCQTFLSFFVFLFCFLFLLLFFVGGGGSYCRVEGWGCYSVRC